MQPMTANRLAHLPREVDRTGRPIEGGEQSMPLRHRGDTPIAPQCSLDVDTRRHPGCRPLLGARSLHKLGDPDGINRYDCRQRAPHGRGVDLRDQDPAALAEDRLLIADVRQVVLAFQLDETRARYLPGQVPTLFYA